MARTDIATLIVSILEAYAAGLQLFKAGDHKRKKRGASEVSSKAVNARILSSLTERPREIRAAYDEALLQHGRNFEDGDGPSQTKLAQILLRLNTGLTRFLNLVLPTDGLIQPPSRTAILHLSEAAATDTLSVLSDLGSRLSLYMIETKAAPQKSHSSDHIPKKAPITPSRPSKAHGLQSATGLQSQHGAWIRHKKHPSAVSVIRCPKSKGSAKAVVHTPTKVKTTKKPLYDASSALVTPPPTYSRLAPIPPGPVTREAAVVHRKDQNFLSNEPSRTMLRQPSMYLVSAEFFGNPQPVAGMPPAGCFDSSCTTSRARHERTLEVAEPARARPVSMMTFMTASTKLGEIPEHRLPDRMLTTQQQVRIPVPYVLPEMLEQPKRKSGRGFKFWRKGLKIPQVISA